MKFKLTIFAVLLLAGASFAQESISNGASISQGDRIIPPVVPLCDITTTSLPGGTQGSAYDAFIQTANCFPPVSFAVISGTLPSWAFLNHSTGEITGIPDAGGVTNFVIEATDGLGHKDQFNPTLSITATSSGSPLPPDPSLAAFDLSLAGTPANGPTICVGTPLDATQLPGGACGTSYPGTTTGLQTALDNAACGQIINVANIQGLAPVNIPSNVKCPANNWVWLSFHDISDPVFPPEMTRADPSFAGIPQSAFPQIPYPFANSGNTPARHMSQIVIPATSNKACLSLNVPTSGTNTPSIGHWREWGLQCNRDQSADPVTALINLGFQPGQNTNPPNLNQDCSIGSNNLPINPVQCAADQPEEIIIDRNVIQGDAQRQTVRGIALGGSRNVFVMNNFGADIQASYAGGQGDSQFFFGGGLKGLTKLGNWYFFNNETSASTEGSLFCGDYVEPLNPITGSDGVPKSVIWDHSWFIKNFLWDTQRGQASQESLINEGIIYPPVPDQEIVWQPSAVGVQQGTSFNLNNTWLYDSAGGWNRWNDNNATGTAKVDGTTYTTVTSANGILTKTNLTVGSNPWKMESIVQWKYTACSGNNVPAGIGCTGATTPGAHTIVFDKTVIDGRLATLGNNRHLVSTITITVTTGAPTNQIALTPSTPDLQIQPSYSDGFNNKRQYGYVFTAALNFSSNSLTWNVCESNGANCVVNGNSTVGQICKVTAVPCTAPGSNDPSVVYVSGNIEGSHVIKVTSAAGTSTSQPINVSKTSPVWAYDLKAMAVKNGWEAKCLNQGVLKNSIVENAHGSQGNGGGQKGSGALNQPINQASQVNDGNGVNVGYGPENISDLLVDHVHFLHVGAGFIVAALNSAKGIHRLTYSNLLLEDVSASRYGHGFQNPLFAQFLQFSGAGCQKAPCTVLSWTSPTTPLADNVFFRHITEVGGSNAAPGIYSWMSIGNNNAQFQLGPFAVNDSIFQAPGVVPFVNDDGDPNDCNKATSLLFTTSEAIALQGQGYIPAKPCFSSYSLSRNLLLDNTTNPLSFTSTIWNNVASSSPDVFIKSGDNGDYRVPFGSQYDAGGARDASDGLALGADIDGILKSDNEVRWGSLSPLQITTTTLPTATHNTAYSFLLTVSGGTGPYVWSAPAGVVQPGAEDFIDYGAMSLPDRNNFHLNGTLNKYFKLDAGLLWWIKATSGNPWDGEVVGPDYVKQWFTEDIFTNASSFKMYVNPVSLWSRYHVPGADDVVYTPGPNKYSTTTNCGLDNQPLIDNLGVRGELTGPFTDITWQSTFGGNIPDNTPYLLAQKWIKCTANDITKCTDEEDYWLVKGYGQVQWCPKTWNGSTYVTGTCTRETTKTAGGPPTANFQCGVPRPAVSDGLPTGNILTNQPPFTLGDSSGILSGTPTSVGTTKFTVQVEDSLGHIAQKTLSLAVQ